MLRFYLDLDVREIADHLGIADGHREGDAVPRRQTLAETLDDTRDEQEHDRADS